MQGPRTGSFEPLSAGTTAQTHQSQAGAVSLFGMGPPFHDLLDQATGLGTGFLRPTDQPGRCPFRMGPMGTEHMFRQSRRLVIVAAAMRGDAPTFVVDLDNRGGVTHFQCLMDQRVGHTVGMVIHGNVVVDIDATVLPLGLFIPVGW